MKRKLGINIDCLRGVSPLDAMDLAKSAGFESFFVGTHRPEQYAAIPSLKEKADAIVLDGRPFVPHVPDFFSDLYLHPNDMGFKCYANALYEAMKPHVK